MRWRGRRSGRRSSGVCKSRERSGRRRSVWGPHQVRERDCTMAFGGVAPLEVAPRRAAGSVTRGECLAADVGRAWRELELERPDAMHVVECTTHAFLAGLNAFTRPLSTIRGRQRALISSRFLGCGAALQTARLGVPPLCARRVAWQKLPRALNACSLPSRQRAGHGCRERRERPGCVLASRSAACAQIEQGGAVAVRGVCAHGWHTHSMCRVRGLRLGRQGCRAAQCTPAYCVMMRSRRQLMSPAAARGYVPLSALRQGVAGPQLREP